MTTRAEPGGKGVPAVLVCGATPAAKLQLIHALLRSRPAQEVWAVVTTPEIVAGPVNRAGIEFEEVAGLPLPFRRAAISGRIGSPAAGCWRAVSAHRVVQTPPGCVKRKR